MGLDIKTNFTNENTFCPSQTLFYQLNFTNIYSNNIIVYILIFI